MQKKHKVHSFQNNLKRMLLRYSLIPVVGVVSVCFVIALCMGSFWVISQNHRSSNLLVNTLNTTISEYSVLLEELSKMDGIIDEKTSSTKRQIIMRQLYTVATQSGYTADFYIIGKDSQVYVSTKEELSEEEKKEISKKWTILQLISENPEHVQTITSKGNTKNIFIGKAVMNDNEMEGFLVLTLGEKIFSQLLSDCGERSIITHDDSWAFATNSYLFVDAVGRLDHSVRERTGFFSFKNRQYYGYYQKGISGNIVVYTFSDITDMIRMLLTIFVTACIVMLIMFILSIKNAGKVSDKATQDIRHLNTAFTEVSKGNLNTELSIHSSTEFENIGNVFLQMLDNLRKHIAQNKELAEMVAYEQVKQLSAQFKSHFLFNTLDNIRFICRIDPCLAENMVISLSELLRYNTSNADEKVTIEEDVKYMKLYLEIIKIRFGDQFTYQINIPEELKDCLTQKLLLQPLMENAIKYGFKVKNSLNIMIEAVKKENIILFSCKDNGPGISEEQLKKIQYNLSMEENKTPHLGLYNVHRKLQLTYGFDFGLKIKNDNGMIVTVSFPIEYE